MTAAFGTILLVYTLAICLPTAIVGFAQPARFAGYLGFQFIDRGGANEIRSQYASFFLLVGVACACALSGVVRRDIVYVLTLIIFAGLLLGRVVSLAVEGWVTGFNPTIRMLFVIEVIGVALAAAALHGAPLG